MSNFSCKQKLRFLRHLPLVLGIITIPASSLAEVFSGQNQPLDADFTTLSGGPLSLQQTALITMKNSPNIIKGKLNLQTARAYAQMATGGFDIYTSLDIGNDHNRPFYGADEDIQQIRFGLNKYFRTGISASVNTGVIRSDSRLAYPVQDTKNLSSLYLSISIPLLKGRGYVSAAADETAAKIQSQAAELDFYHNVSSLLLDSINAYWDYKMAIENLEIHQEAERTIENWVDASIEDRKLRYGDVKAFLKRNHDRIARVKGYLASKHRNTIAALEEVNRSKAALAVTMGISHKQIVNIGEPSEKIKHDWSDVLAKIKKQSTVDKWIAQAQENRLDIQASKLQVEASEVKLAKARHDIMPQLNLHLNAGRNAVELGNGYNNYIGAFNSDTHGTDIGAMLKFVYPLGNNIAKAKRDLANAEYRTTVIHTSDLVRKISVEVGVDAGQLKRRMKEAVIAYKAVEFYRHAVENSYEADREHFLQSSHTLLHLLDLEDKLTEASHHLNTSLQELTKIITKLNFHTGQILLHGSINPDELKLGKLSTIPGL